VIAHPRIPYQMCHRRYQARRCDPELGVGDGAGRVRLDIDAVSSSQQHVAGRRMVFANALCRFENSRNHRTLTLMASSTPSRPGARLIRVFVSSTFQDMHAERDFLNRIVWPELRNRCLRRSAAFVGIDLRWGITREEAEGRGALELCLEEIDRCNYFVGLIGERYGWVPASDAIPAAMFAGQSITELEVRHALETLQPRRTLFYLRDASSEAAMGFESIFREPDAARRARLADLRRDVTRSGRRTRTYSATFEGIRISPALLPGSLTAADRRLLEDGVIDARELARAGADLRGALAEYGTAALGGLEAWGERLQEDLWAAIEQDLDMNVAVAPDVAGRADHERFLLEHTTLFVGRDDLVANVMAYASDGAGGQPLVVTGSPGSGKSALMAECARRLRERFPAAVVVPHFIGAAPGSTAPAATVRSLCEALLRQRRLHDEIPADREGLFSAFPMFLDKAARAGPVFLLIDALDQLDSWAGGHDLPWLPPVLPRDARLILSTLDGPVLDRLREQVPPQHVLQVEALPAGDRATLVHELLARRGKRLTTEQSRHLLDTRLRPEAGLPLYLAVAIEELSLFGQHEALDRRIDGLPPTLTSLFDQVLARVEQDHGRREAELVLRMLAASRAGLLESEVLDLLESRFPGFARMRWIRLYRSLEFYLRRMDEGSGAGLLGFYHDQIRQAVYRRYFNMDSRAARSTATLTQAHKGLAAYFDAAARDGDSLGAWSAGRARPLGELPFHLAHSGQWSALRDVLTEYPFLHAKVTALGPQALVDDFVLALDAPRAFPDGTAAGLRLLQAALRLSAHALERDPAQLPGQLLGRLQGSRGGDVRRVLIAAQAWRGAAWLRPRNACLSSPGGSLLRVLVGEHAGEYVGVTPDGRRVVATAAGRLSVWDVATGRLERTLLEKYDQAFGVTPDGKAVVTAGAKGTLEIRDLDSGRIRSILEGQLGKLTAVALSPDGHRLVTGNNVFDATKRLEIIVSVWDLATGTRLHRLAGHVGGIRDLAITPDGVGAISVGDDRKARVWNLQKGELLHELVHDYFVVTAVAVTSNGHQAVTACADGALTIWDLLTGGRIRRFSCPRRRTTRVKPYVNAIAIASGGMPAVFAMMDETLRVWNPVSHKFGQVLTGHADDVLDVALSANGAVAVSTSRDGTIRVWRPGERAEFVGGRAHASRITSLALTPDASRTLSASWDHTLAVWDTQTGDQLSTLTGHAEAVNAVLAVPDGRRAVSSSSDRTVKVWNLRSGKEERSFPGGTGGEWPTERLVVLTSDGHSIVNAARSGTIAVHGVASRSTIWQREGESQPRYVAVTPDGRHVLVCPGEGDVWILDAQSGSRTHRLRVAGQPAEIVVSTADGRGAAVGYGNGTVRLWDVVRGTRVLTLRGHSDVISALGATPDGKLLISCDRQGHVRVWDLAAGIEHARLEGHSNRIWILAVAPDSRYCVTGSADHTVRVWDVQAGRPVAALLTEGDVWACAIGPDSRTIVAGGDSGRVHFLDLVEAGS
jgi:WD40 repeat protein